MPRSGTPPLDRVEDGRAPRGVDRARGAEVADAGDHDAGRRARDRAGAAGVVERRAHGRQRLAHRRQVAGAVIDQRDHKSPFVDGSVRPSCRSFEQATRSARANALKIASTW